MSHTAQIAADMIDRLREVIAELQAENERQRQQIASLEEALRVCIACHQ